MMDNIVAIYNRLSEEDKGKLNAADESRSIQNQKSMLISYAMNQGWEIYNIYSDDDYKGSDRSRPAFNQLLQDAEARKFNIVLCKSQARFTRELEMVEKIIHGQFAEWGIRFVGYADNADTANKGNKKSRQINGLVNEWYLEDLSDNIKTVLTDHRKKGMHIGSFALYGYMKDPCQKGHLVIDPEAAEVVREVFGLYASGMGRTAIARLLNDRGIPNPTEYKRRKGLRYKGTGKQYGSLWKYYAISDMLSNEMYIGNMVQNKKSQRMRGKSKAQDKEDWIVVKGTHEAIIDDETWNKVQDLLKRRTRNLDLNSNMSIFAGFLKCGDCGRALTKKIGTPGHGGGIVNYYCGTYIRSGRQYCTPHPMPHLVLEKIILEDLKAIMLNIDNMREVIEQNQAATVTVKRVNENEKTRLTAELEKVRKLKKAVYEDYRSELISKDEFVTYRQDYLKKEELLEEQLESIDSKQDEATPDIFESPWIKRLLELRTIEKLDRDIVVEMIHEITVYENHKIKITYNFSSELEALFKTVYTNKENIG